MYPSRTVAGRLARRLTSACPVVTRPTAPRSATAAFGALFAGLSLASMAAAQQPYGQQQYGNANAPYPAYGQPAPQEFPQDPPSRVARLSLAQGTVSVQPANVQDFSPAEVNYPLTTGDRLWADAGSLAELQLGAVAVRLGQQTDFTVTGLTDTLAQFGLAQGSVHLRTFSLDPGTTTELDTPNGAVTVLQPGDLRVDVYPGSNLAVFTLLSGAAQVDAEGFSQQLRPGESLQLAGSEMVSARDVRRPRGDGLDSFSFNQDNAYQASLASEDAYVSSDTIGAPDLINYGDWSTDADFGAVWFPRAVGVGWQPYRYGHWAYVGPWGWTWIAAEPWGFTPFHYGRWNRFGDRWGWIPGPRVVRPVYSPALVAFVGGGPGSSGVGVTAWFPLGPREPYQPWYRTSDRYVTRVNVTNIYNRNTVEVRNTYFNAGRGPSPFRFDPGRQYVNRPATIAVPQGVFAGGRPVHNAELRVDGRQFASAPVLQRPMASPERSIVSPGPARALPPQVARPQWQTRSGGAPPFQRPGNFGTGTQPQGGQGQATPGNSGTEQGRRDFRGNGSTGLPAQTGQAGQDTADRMQHAPIQRAPINPYGAAPLQTVPAQRPQPAPVNSQQPVQGQGSSDRLQRAPAERAPMTPNGPAQMQQNPVQRPQPDSGYRNTGGPARGGQPDNSIPPQPVRAAPQAPTQNTPSQPVQSAPAPRLQPSGPSMGQSQPGQGYRGRQADSFNPQQPRPSFDQGRPGNYQPPVNNAPPSRPAAPPMQSVPRPAPQAQPQPSAQPRPAAPATPAAQPQAAPKPK